MVSTRVSISGYQASEELYNGSRTVVYRGYRETDSLVETLLQAFERVSLGATEMMLVAGFSGIGKTAVVNEVHNCTFAYFVRVRGINALRGKE